jgi:hypothetical protein
MTTLTVGEGPYAGRTNAAIQRAVDDAAGAGGGRVVVPGGTYRMHDALHLRSGVRVVGQGGPVLVKVPSVESRIPAFLGYGHYEVLVEEPEKFPVGTGVHVLDDKAAGFYTTVATVVGREGDRLFLDRMLNHDYRADDGARVVSVYPIVEAEGVADASVEDLVIDGSSAEETFLLNGCRGAGVFLIRAARVAVRGLEVRNYRGDGIGLQQCTDVLVERCDVHHNVGQGLHPGSGSVRYVLRGSRVHDNGGCGIFYCLRTTHSACCGNEILDNGEAGISLGERDTDHRIEGNRIAGNAWAGILFRAPLRQSGDRVRIVKNAIGPNAAREGGGEIAIPAAVRDVAILENAFAEGAVPLRVERGCEGIRFWGNTVGGRDAGPADVAGAADEVLADRPRELTPVGPEALGPDGARHLGVAHLEPWDEGRLFP